MLPTGLWGISPRCFLRCQRTGAGHFGTLFVFTLIGLVMQLIGDIVYTFVDPRIVFETRG